LIGFRWFLDFAQEVGAIEGSEAQALDRRARVALSLLADDQARRLVDADPVGLFMRLLRACLGSGRAHVRDAQGNRPEDPALWGWCQREVTTSQGPRMEWQAQGSTIGWL